MVKSTALRRIEQVNKELWILLSLFSIALLLNYVVASQRMVLGFYALPTVGSAYFNGKRHATLTALASVLLVVLLLIFSGNGAQAGTDAAFNQWLDITVWGGSLLITGYLMGTLCERKNAQL